MYSIFDEGILLKKVEAPELSDEDSSIKQLKEKSEKISLDKKKVDKAVDDYKKTKKGGLDLI